MTAPDCVVKRPANPRELIEASKADNGRAARFIRLPEVTLMTALSRATIYKRMKARSFPQAIVLSVRLTVWIDLEVQAWMAQQIERQRVGSI